MALDTTVDTLVEIIGHDGSEVINETLPDPHKRRGHHVQECVYAAMQLGFSPTMLEFQPRQIFAGGEVREVRLGKDQFSEWILGLLCRHRGVLNGRAGNGFHAVAFDNGLIFDPDGRVETYESYTATFEPYLIWITG